MNKKGKVSRFVEKNAMGLIVVSMLVALYIVLAFVQTKIQSSAVDGKIERSYADVITKLNLEPKNFTDRAYESAIPKIILEDMRKVAESESGEILAVYSGKNTRMVVTKNNLYDNGVAVTFYEGDNLVGEVEQNVSFYTDGHSIYVYGSWYRSRTLNKYVFSQESVERVELENPYLDLYGTDVQWDDIRSYAQESTLVRCKEAFYFYYLGKQIGISYRLPSGTVKEMDYDKILNNQNDMYYLFYSASVTNPWIVFSKVGSEVDYVLDTVEENCLSISYDDDQYWECPVFVKDGKSYCGIPDVTTAMECSQKNGGSDKKDATLYDFTIKVVELSEDAIVRVQLDQYFMDWYIVYWYGTDDRMGYMKERIYGLDSGLLSFIPDEELEPFRKDIDLNDVDLMVQELKSLYDEYVPRKVGNMQL